VNVHQALISLQHRLIVSVQADEGEPLSPATVLWAMVQSVVAGGATGLRLANTDVIMRAKQYYPHLSVIGLTKPKQIPINAHALVYITPTWSDITLLAKAGVDIVAMDATQRPRPEGVLLETLVSLTRQTYPSLALMADVATLDEGLKANQLGFDCISTTLSGYTTETLTTPPNTEPDWALLSNLVKALPTTPIILEGRVWSPKQVKQGLDLGAFAVVVGSAITRPHHITQRFCAML
jgi:N-acylglucosamine-6-phosphate 2-epimerase